MDSSVICGLITWVKDSHWETLWLFWVYCCPRCEGNGDLKYFHLVPTFEWCGLRGRTESQSKKLLLGPNWCFLTFEWWGLCRHRSGVPSAGINFPSLIFPCLVPTKVVWAGSWIVVWFVVWSPGWKILIEKPHGFSEFTVVPGVREMETSSIFTWWLYWLPQTEEGNLMRQK